MVQSHTPQKNLYFSSYRVRSRPVNCQELYYHHGAGYHLETARNADDSGRSLLAHSINTLFPRNRTENLTRLWQLKPFMKQDRNLPKANLVKISWKSHPKQEGLKALNRSPE